MTQPTNLPQLLKLDILPESKLLAVGLLLAEGHYLSADDAMESLALGPDEVDNAIGALCRADVAFRDRAGCRLVLGSPLEKVLPPKRTAAPAAAPAEPEPEPEPVMPAPVEEPEPEPEPDLKFSKKATRRKKVK